MKMKNEGVEEKRLNALREYELLVTEAEDELNKLTQLAAAICNTPIALISLVDENRQWFRAKFGIDVSETERKIAFCNHTITQDEVFEVCDALKDERFAKNPLVTGDPNIRFYSGAPLITEEGYKLGSLCVIDKVPKTLAAEQKEALQLLSKQIINTIELKRSKKALEIEKSLLEQTIILRTAELTESNNKILKNKKAFKALAENSSDIISRVNKHYQYTYANKAVVPESGLPPEYYIGKTPKQAGFPENICELMESNMNEIVATGKAVSSYFEFPGIEGRKFNYNYMTGVPEYDLEGSFTSILISVRDITELKLNELKLIQANKELDRFVYSASHELRAPLKSILGLSRVALMDFKAKNYEYEEQYMHGIERCTLRLDRLVSDIIDYSRNSRQDLNLEMINFSELIPSIIGDLNYTETTPVEKRVNIDEEIGFFSDKRRLAIVLTNIISNALKYSDSSKNKSFISIKIRTTTDSCFIEIEDNGIGIDEEHLDNIYNMFYRATEASDGAGLGLYIVKETLGMLLGKIEVTSILNEGVTFKIEVPNSSMTI